MNDWDITNVSQNSQPPRRHPGRDGGATAGGEAVFGQRVRPPRAQRFPGRGRRALRRLGSCRLGTPSTSTTTPRTRAATRAPTASKNFSASSATPPSTPCCRWRPRSFDGLGSSGFPPGACSRSALPQLLDDATELNGNLWANWRGFYKKAGADTSLPLFMRTSVRIREESVPTPTLDWLNYKAPPSPLQWRPKAGLVLCSAPGARLALGKTSGKTHDLGDVRFTVHDREGNPQAHLALVTLDGCPVKESRNLLLCALRRAENPNMRWNDKRNSVGNGAGRRRPRAGPGRLGGHHPAHRLHGGVPGPLGPPQGAGRARRDGLRHQSGGRDGVVSPVAVGSGPVHDNCSPPAWASSSTRCRRPCPGRPRRAGRPAPRPGPPCTGCESAHRT